MWKLSVVHSMVPNSKMMKSVGMGNMFNTCRDGYGFNEVAQSLKIDEAQQKIMRNDEGQDTDTLKENKHHEEVLLLPGKKPSKG